MTSPGELQTLIAICDSTIRLNASEAAGNPCRHQAAKTRTKFRQAATPEVVRALCLELLTLCPTCRGTQVLSTIAGDARCQSCGPRWERDAEAREKFMRDLPEIRLD